MRIVFMGTPEIAATCLKKLISDGFDVAAAYTQPDRPKGRGMKTVYSPVKEAALAAGIARGWPLEECARLAAGAGALACTAETTIHPGMSWENIEYILNKEEQ